MSVEQQVIYPAMARMTYSIKVMVANPVGKDRY
jgi:hypothetical protein